MEPLLEQEGGQRGPLLRAIWQMSSSTFLLATFAIVISDVFRFAVPKLLRWVQAFGALLMVVLSLMPSFHSWGVGVGQQLFFGLCLVLQSSGPWRWVTGKDTEEGEKNK